MSTILPDLPESAMYVDSTVINQNFQKIFSRLNAIEAQTISTLRDDLTAYKRRHDNIILQTIAHKSERAVLTKYWTLLMAMALRKREERARAHAVQCIETSARRSLECRYFTKWKQASQQREIAIRGCEAMARATGAGLLAAYFNKLQRNVQRKRNLRHAIACAETMQARAQQKVVNRYFARWHRQTRKRQHLEISSTIVAEWGKARQKELLERYYQAWQSLGVARSQRKQNLAKANQLLAATNAGIMARYLSAWQQWQKIVAKARSRQKAFDSLQKKTLQKAMQETYTQWQLYTQRQQHIRKCIDLMMIRNEEGTRRWYFQKLLEFVDERKRKARAFETCQIIGTYCAKGLLRQCYDNWKELHQKRKQRIAAYHTCRIVSRYAAKPLLARYYGMMQNFLVERRTQRARRESAYQACRLILRQSGRGLLQDYYQRMIQFRDRMHAKRVAQSGLLIACQQIASKAEDRTLATFYHTWMRYLHQRDVTRNRLSALRSISDRAKRMHLQQAYDTWCDYRKCKRQKEDMQNARQIRLKKALEGCQSIRQHVAHVAMRSAFDKWQVTAFHVKKNRQGTILMSTSQAREELLQTLASAKEELASIRHQKEEIQKHLPLDSLPLLEELAQDVLWQKQGLKELADSVTQRVTKMEAHMKDRAQEHEKSISELKIDFTSAMASAAEARRKEMQDQQHGFEARFEEFQSNLLDLNKSALEIQRMFDGNMATLLHDLEKHENQISKNSGDLHQMNLDWRESVGQLSHNMIGHEGEYTKLQNTNLELINSIEALAGNVSTLEDKYKADFNKLEHSMEHQDEAHTRQFKVHGDHLSELSETIGKQASEARRLAAESEEIYSELKQCKDNVNSLSVDMDSQVADRLRQQREQLTSLVQDMAQQSISMGDSLKEGLESCQNQLRQQWNEGEQFKGNIHHLFEEIDTQFAKCNQDITELGISTADARRIMDNSLVSLTSDMENQRKSSLELFDDLAKRLATLTAAVDNGNSDIMSKVKIHDSRLEDLAANMVTREAEGRRLIEDQQQLFGQLRQQAGDLTEVIEAAKKRDSEYKRMAMEQQERVDNELRAQKQDMATLSTEMISREANQKRYVDEQCQELNSKFFTELAQVAEDATRQTMSLLKPLQTADEEATLMLKAQERRLNDLAQNAEKREKEASSLREQHLGLADQLRQHQQELSNLMQRLVEVESVTEKAATGRYEDLLNQLAALKSEMLNIVNGLREKQEADLAAQMEAELRAELASLDKRLTETRALTEDDLKSIVASVQGQQVAIKDLLQKFVTKESNDKALATKTSSDLQDLKKDIVDQSNEILDMTSQREAALRKVVEDGNMETATQLRSQASRVDSMGQELAKREAEGRRLIEGFQEMRSQIGQHKAYVAELAEDVVNRDAEQKKAAMDHQDKVASELRVQKQEIAELSTDVANMSASHKRYIDEQCDAMDRKLQLQNNQLSSLAKDVHQQDAILQKAITEGDGYLESKLKSHERLIDELAHGQEKVATASNGLRHDLQLRHQEESSSTARRFLEQEAQISRLAQELEATNGHISTNLGKDIEAVHQASLDLKDKLDKRFASLQGQTQGLENAFSLHQAKFSHLIAEIEEETAANKSQKDGLQNQIEGHDQRMLKLTEEVTARDLEKEKKIRQVQQELIDKIAQQQQILSRLGETVSAQASELHILGSKQMDEISSQIQVNVQAIHNFEHKHNDLVAEVRKHSNTLSHLDDTTNAHDETLHHIKTGLELGRAEQERQVQVIKQRHAEVIQLLGEQDVTTRKWLENELAVLSGRLDADEKLLATQKDDTQELDMRAKQMSNEILDLFQKLGSCTQQLELQALNIDEGFKHSEKKQHALESKCQYTQLQLTKFLESWEEGRKKDRGIIEEHKTKLMAELDRLKKQIEDLDEEMKQADSMCMRVMEQEQEKVTSQLVNQFNTMTAVKDRVEAADEALIQQRRDLEEHKRTLVLGIEKHDHAIQDIIKKSKNQEATQSKGLDDIQASLNQKLAGYTHQQEIIHDKAKRAIEEIEQRIEQLRAEMDETRNVEGKIVKNVHKVLEGPTKLFMDLGEQYRKLSKDLMVVDTQKVSRDDFQETIQRMMRDQMTVTRVPSLNESTGAESAPDLGVNEAEMAVLKDGKHLVKKTRTVQTMHRRILTSDPAGQWVDVSTGQQPQESDVWLHASVLVVEEAQARSKLEAWERWEVEGMVSQFPESLNIKPPTPIGNNPEFLTVLPTPAGHRSRSPSPFRGQTGSPSRSDPRGTSYATRLSPSRGSASPLRMAPKRDPVDASPSTGRLHSSPYRGSPSRLRPTSFGTSFGTNLSVPSAHGYTFSTPGGAGPGPSATEPSMEHQTKKKSSNISSY